MKNVLRWRRPKLQMQPLHYANLIFNCSTLCSKTFISFRELVRIVHEITETRAEKEKRSKETCTYQMLINEKSFMLEHIFFPPCPLSRPFSVSLANLWEKYLLFLIKLSQRIFFKAIGIRILKLKWLYRSDVHICAKILRSKFHRNAVNSKVMEYKLTQGNI